MLIIMFKTENKLYSIVQHFLIYTFSIISVGSFSILYVVFALIRQIVNLYLHSTVRYYGGLISTADLPWAVENVSKNIINIVILIKYDKAHRRIKSFYDSFKEKSVDEIFRNPDKYLKLSGTRHQFLGYQYMLKYSLSVDDCFKKLDINIKNEEDLKKYVSKSCNLPLPKNHTGLWDITVGTRPISWGNNSETEDIYPVIFRTHHIIGDGWSLMNFVISTLCDPQYQGDYFLKSVLRTPIRTSKGTTNNILNKLFITLKSIGDFLKILLNCSAIMLRQVKFMRNKEEIVFDAKNFTGKKIIRFATEKKEELVPLCREMRRKFEDAKFVQIIFASIGYSLSGYFQKRFQHVPDFINAFITILLSLPKKQSAITFENHFTAAKMHLPINPNFSMKESVEFFSEPVEGKRLMEDAQINYLLMHNMGVLPLPLLRIIIDLFQIPIAMTNLPMPPKLEMFDGCEVFDIISFPPNWSHSGITLSSTSYKNRFQIGILVDESLISSEDEAQNIVDDILRNFKTLNKELSSCSN